MPPSGVAPGPRSPWMIAWRSLPSRPPDVLEIDEALDRLAAVDERKAKVIELRDFGGMDREEVAAALGLSVPTVKRDLRLGAARLRRFLGGGAD